MFGLLGGEDFSDGSDSEHDSDSGEEDGVTDKSDTEEKVKCKTKLPFPDLEVPYMQQGQLSVFSNQYKEEEEAKKAVLERHVEMSNTAPVDSSKQASKEKKYRSPFYSRQKGKLTQTNSDEDPPKAKRKRHAGLSGTLQPPKKFMQSFHKQQAEEKPWLSKK